MKTSDLSKDNILQTLPSVLANDAGMQPLGDTAARMLALMWAQVDLPSIYARIDELPEELLDILAKDFKVVWYDYNYPLETKRLVIKDSFYVHKHLGTVGAVKRALSDIWPTFSLEEWYDYGGEPFHFRVTAEGDLTVENEAWARRAIQTAKNVRSVLDSLRIGHKCLIGITAEAGVLTKFTYPLTGAENYAGRWPQENLLGAVEESHAGVEVQADPYTISYPLTGTVPNISLLCAVDESRTGVAGEATGYPYGYPITGAENYAGRWPQENLLAEVDHPVIPSAQADDMIIDIPYKLCGQDEI